MSSATDFDFVFGKWHVRNERLKERLVGSTEWEAFDATDECRPILGGQGNVSSFATVWSGGLVGMTFRLFNPGTKEWSIYWASTRRPGVLEPPVVGAFVNGVGTFAGPDEHNGTPVITRFIWSRITPANAQWEQALSTDQGKTWETNWIMRFARLS